MAAESSVELKLLVDSKCHRVVFAEADKKFVDFLFTLFSLPLGTVTRLIRSHSMAGLGYLADLYASVEALKDTYLQPNQNKEGILNPKFISLSHCPTLLTNSNSDSNSSAEPKVYLCNNKLNYGYCNNYFAGDSKAICPQCKTCMKHEVQYVRPLSEEAASGGGGFVKDAVTYMVMDDLSVQPMSTISCIAQMNELNIKEVDVLEAKVVTLTVNEGVKLLKASLESKTVLTDVFLGKKAENLQES